MMKIRCDTTCGILFFLFFLLIAGVGEVLAGQWAKLYGGSGGEQSSSIRQTPDGGFIVAGTTSSFGSGDKDLWVVKLGVSGEIEWQKAYGGSGADEASAIRPTTDGGYILLGSTFSFGPGDRDIWVLKLRSDGGVDWQKTYGGPGTEEGWDIEQTLDGGYVLAGNTTTFGAGKTDAWVLKLDSLGEPVWQRAYGGGNDDSARSIRQTLDGGYIFTGTTDSYSASGKKDIWLLKLGPDGAVDWQKTYGTTDDEEGFRVIQTADEGYAVLGSIKYSGKTNAWVIKVDSVGVIKWQGQYGGSGEDKAFAIQQAADGKYILAGSTDSFGSGKKEVWIFRLDTNGYFLWQEVFGTNQDDEAIDVQVTMDGGYTVAGWTDPCGTGCGDVLVLKLDGAGNVPGCQMFGGSLASSGSTGVSSVMITTIVHETNATIQDGGGFIVSTEISPDPLCEVSGPDIAADPQSLSFGQVTMGSSISDEMIIKNVGSMDLEIGDLDITGTGQIDFAIREDGCSGQTLKTKENCTIDILFSPLTKGTRNAVLSISSNDSDYPILYLPLTGEGTPPILLSTPANRASFSACSLYQTPLFSWTVAATFKSYELQFAKDSTFSTIKVKVKTKSPSALLKSNSWKQVMNIPGETGGPVYWRVLGVYPGGKTGYVSDYRSISIEPNRPVENQKIEPVSKNYLPALSWDNLCNVKFKVWFANEDQFLKKYTVSFTDKNPMDGEGKFSQTLTLQQWDSIRNLVGDEAGSRIYWKIESWDGLNRHTLSDTKSFVLQD